MTHLTDLQCSMYVDAALTAAATTAVDTHAAGCADCRERLAVFAQEKQVIAAALGIEDVVPVPRFKTRARLKEFALVNIITCALAWLLPAIWKFLYGELLDGAFSWVASALMPDSFRLAIDSFFFFLQEGTTMINGYVSSIAVISIALACAWFAYAARKRNMMMALCLLGVVGTGLVLPQDAVALEIRTSKMVSVEAGETVEDTLLIGADTIIIDGVINGDLIAGGERIIINGTVNGNLIAMGETVTINGTVSGTVLSAGETVELVGARVKSDFWGAGSSVSIGPDSQIARNATTAGQSISVAGAVGRDLYGFFDQMEIGGAVNKDVNLFGSRTILLGTARIGGDLKFHTDDESNLQRSSSAVVTGNVEVIPMEHDTRPRNQYLRVDYYVTQLLRLVSAFLLGMMLVWLVPQFGRMALGGGVDGLKTAGIGLAALIGMPIMMVLFAITVVGLPLTMLTLFAWVVFIYFAKIVLAFVVGRMLFSSAEETGAGQAKVLLAGLVVILLLVNIPLLGGTLNFLFTIVGMGLLAQQSIRYVSDSSV